MKKANWLRIHENLMRQRLGQHFLKNKSAIRKIVEALDLKAHDTVIEIGPGHGELTEPLARRCEDLGCRVIAVERDEELGSRLQVLGGRENTEIIIGDVLKILDSITYNLKTETYKLTGNIPYYITGKLFRILSEMENKPTLSVFTLQREVAERMAAEPPKMNRLAAVVQFWAKPEIVVWLSEKDFTPPPEVESAIIKLGSRLEVVGVSDHGHNSSENAERYYKMVRVLFQQPRKTILNNLSEILPDKKKIAGILASLGIDDKNRPQDLGVQEILEITRKFQDLGL